MPAKPKSGGSTWEKSPPELIERIGKVVGPLLGAEVRKMFSYPVGFRNGLMFTGLHGKKWFVRLAEEDRAELFRHKGAEPFQVMPGKPMKEYVVMPPGIVESPEKLAHWVKKSHEYVGTLPPKVKKAKRSKS